MRHPLRVDMCPQWEALSPILLGLTGLPHVRLRETTASLNTQRRAEAREPSGCLEQEGPNLAEAGFAEALEPGHCGQVGVDRSATWNQIAKVEPQGWVGRPFLRFRSDGHWVTCSVVFSDI